MSHPDPTYDPLDRHSTHFDDCGCLSQRYEFRLACLRAKIEQDAPVQFVGYQAGLGRPFPLFNINIKGHELNHSTVSIQTLRKLGLDTGFFPTYTEWVGNQQK